MSSVTSLSTLVENRLSEIFGQKNFVEIQTALQKSRAVISGSFIAQCILGEYWEGSDIDIYVSIPEDIPTVAPFDLTPTPCIDTGYDSFPVILKNGISVKYSFGGFLITEIESVLYQLSGENQSSVYCQQDGEPEGPYDGLFGESICGMREYSIKNDKNENEQKVQVMQVKTKDLPLGDFIFRSFDFDFCRAFYGVVENRSFVNCFDLKAILSKCCEMKYTVHLKKSLERFEKYSKRGFRFTYQGECIKSIYIRCLEAAILHKKIELSEFQENGEVPLDFVEQLAIQ